MDTFENALEAAREAANACGEVARGEHGSLGGETVITEAGRAEAALRAAVKDLGVGERMALSPAVSACETLLIAVDDHEDEITKALATKVRAAQTALRDVMALPGEEGPDDPGDNEHGRAHK